MGCSIFKYPNLHLRLRTRHLNLCVCVCVCVCVTHTHTHTHSLTHSLSLSLSLSHTHTRTHTHVRTYIHTYDVHIDTYIHDTCIHTCKQTHASISAYTSQLTKSSNPLDLLLSEDRDVDISWHSRRQWLRFEEALGVAGVVNTQRLKGGGGGVNICSIGGWSM
jgi:hypothetical protein